ncbi:MAG: UPF0175 family protein [Candidatus Helarchaeota archaeon]
MKSEKLKIAFKMYLKGKVSLGKAAELAEISIWEMIDDLHDKNISSKYNLKKINLFIKIHRIYLYFLKMNIKFA